MAAVAVSYRRLIVGWDEYSHWAYIVKTMFALNDFGTNPAAHALYFDYPPAMPLLQYFTMALNGNYTEWLMYAVYLVAATSMFLPFLSGLKYKNVLFNLLGCGLIVILPTVFFLDYYTNLQIDKFLGLTFGFGMAMLFQNAGKRDALARLTVLATVFVLILLKQAGSLFALFVLAGFMIDVLMTRKADIASAQQAKALRKEKLCWTVAGIGVYAFAQLSWLWQVGRNPASETLDISSMSNTLHGVTGDAGEIIRNFFARTVKPIERFGFLHVSDAVFMAVFFGLLVLLWVLYRGDDKNRRRARTAVLIGLAVDSAVYFIAVLASYLTSFSRFDAMRLASYDRYTGTIFVSLLIFGFVSLVPLYEKLRSKKAKAALIIASFLVLAPFAYVRVPNMLRSKQAAIEEHDSYTYVTNAMQQTVGEDANVYMIAQNTEGFDWLAYRYFMFPAHVYGYWSIGLPYADGDVYTVDLSIDEWKQTIQSEYDYLFIYRCDEAFIERYGDAFEQRSEIGDLRLYRMNPETQLLELIERY